MHQSIHELPKDELVQIAKDLDEIGGLGPGHDDFLHPLYGWDRPKFFITDTTRPGNKNFGWVVTSRKVDLAKKTLDKHGVEYMTNVGGYKFCNHDQPFEDIAVWNVTRDDPRYSERFFYIHPSTNLYAVTLGVRDSVYAGSMPYMFIVCQDCIEDRVKIERPKAKEKYLRFHPAAKRMRVRMGSILPIGDMEKDDISKWHEICKRYGTSYK